MTPEQVQRFYSKVDKADSCWNWTGALRWNGYGCVSINKKNKVSHRVCYELEIGPIPEGLTLDHLCRNRRCVNPAHPEPVTLAENNRRGNSAAAMNARKTHCAKGHELTRRTSPSATGFRWCKPCYEDAVREKRREYYQRNRARLVEYARLKRLAAKEAA